MKKRGKPIGYEGWILVKIQSLLDAGLTPQFPIKVNKKWLESMHLLKAEVEPLTIPKVEIVEEPKETDKIEFSLQEN